MLKVILIVLAVIVGQPQEYATPSGFDQKKSGVDYGSTTQTQFYSNFTGTNRKVNVWTPPNYDKSKEYPVFYLLHGLGGNQASWNSGNFDAILGNLIASGDLKPCIVVMPNNMARKNDEDNSDMSLDPSSPYLMAYNNFIYDLEDNLIPWVKQNYLISTKRADTAIGGFSMGAMESLYIGIKKPEEFGYLGAFEPAPDMLLSESETTLPSAHKSDTLIIIIKGTRDDVVRDGPETYHNSLTKNGVTHIYYTMDVGHEWTAWKNGLYNFGKRLYK